MSRRRASIVVAGLLLAMAPAAARAQEAPPAEAEPNRHAMSLQFGGQVKIREYRSGFKLAGSWAYWLKNTMWLDFGGGVVIHKETDVTFNGGLRWKFRRPGDAVRPYVRTSVELAALLEDDNRFAMALRGGGGAGYYSSPGFGATMEASIALGPAFGGQGGVTFAMGLDILLGVEFLF